MTNFNISTEYCVENERASSSASRVTCTSAGDTICQIVDGSVLNQATIDGQGSCLDNEHGQIKMSSPIEEGADALHWFGSYELARGLVSPRTNFNSSTDTFGLKSVEINRSSDFGTEHKALQHSARSKEICSSSGSDHEYEQSKLESNLQNMILAASVSCSDTAKTYDMATTHLGSAGQDNSRVTFAEGLIDIPDVYDDSWPRTGGEQGAEGQLDFLSVSRAGGGGGSRRASRSILSHGFFGGAGGDLVHHHHQLDGSASHRHRTSQGYGEKDRCATVIETLVPTVYCVADLQFPLETAFQCEPSLESV